jgi:hypothetical protein
MQNLKSICAEHKKACKELDALMQKGIRAGGNGPLPEDVNQYFHLSTIKETLEWVHTGLIKTIAKPGDPNYLNELMGHRFYALGPVNAALTWPR